MLNDEIKNLMDEIDSHCEKIKTGIENNMKDGKWYSSWDNHEKILKKVETIKLIIDL